MSKQSNFQRTGMILALVLFFCGALAQTGVSFAKTLPLTAKLQDKCAATTDAAIVADIKAQIKADKRFKSIRKRIQINSVGHVVTLRGKVFTSNQSNALVKLVRASNCVKQAINKLKVLDFSDCDIGQKLCPGGICAPKGLPCPQGKKKRR